MSNSNPPNNLDYDGEILKMTLDGRIVGKFGRAGKLLKEFGTVNSIDCRNENELYVGELGNWRVQRVTLKADGSRDEVDKSQVTSHKAQVTTSQSPSVANTCDL